MATTKGRTAATPRPRTTAPRSTSSTPAKLQSFVASTTETVKKRPVATAAIATGTLSALAAAVFGFFAWKKSGKSFSDFSGDVATSVKDKASETATRAKEIAGEASTFVKDGVTEAKTKAKEFTDRRKDGVDVVPLALDKPVGTLSQNQVAEEASSLKTLSDTQQTFPADPVIDSQTKTGAISY